jgi:hypothetical protein
VIIKDLLGNVMDHAAVVALAESETSSPAGEAVIDRLLHALSPRTPHRTSVVA